MLLRVESLGGLHAAAVIKLHCIIHQENLCGKILYSALKNVMSTVTKIVIYLSHALLQHKHNFDFYLKRWKVHTMMYLCTAVADG